MARKKPAAKVAPVLPSPPKAQPLAVQAEVERLLSDATPGMVARMIERFNADEMSPKEATAFLSLAMRTLAVRETMAKKLGLSRYAEGGKVREITNNNFFAGQAMTPEAIAQFVMALHQPGGGGLPAPKVIDAEPGDA